MAHWALAFHALCLQYLHLNEDLAADGFESYLHSKYFPHHLNILIGKNSQFFYAFDFATMRRKGRMSPAQRKHRDYLDRICRPDPKGIEKSMVRLSEEFIYIYANRYKSIIKLFTDEHEAYPRAFRRHKVLYVLMQHKIIEHIAKKSTKEPGWSNNMWSVNYMDRQFRKDIVNYVRYTVNTAKNTCCLLERICIYQLYHNHIKLFRENTPLNAFTHWNMAGGNSMIFKYMLEERFRWRPFESLLHLTPVQKGLWFRLYHTPLKKRGEYLPKYVYG